nr:alpha/beta hydrolase fold carboxyl esterase [uncultured bacterium]
MHSVTTYKDLSYYTGSEYHHKKHLLDLYIPQDTGTCAMLLFVHGGAWSIGDKSMHEHVGRALARKGIGTAVINYRLSPEVLYPDHCIDVTRAIQWSMNEAPHYIGTTGGICLMGHSAGAHLVALVSLHPEYRKHIPIKFIKGVVCISGIFDIPALMNTSFGRSIIPPAFGKNPHTWKDASPVYHVSGKSPPFLVMVAEKDPVILKAQSLRFHDVVPFSRHYILPGRNHFNSIHKFGKRGDTAASQVVTFIDDQYRVSSGSL